MTYRDVGRAGNKVFGGRRVLALKKNSHDPDHGKTIEVFRGTKRDPSTGSRRRDPGEIVTGMSLYTHLSHFGICLRNSVKGIIAINTSILLGGLLHSVSWYRENCPGLAPVLSGMTGLWQGRYRKKNPSSKAGSQAGQREREDFRSDQNDLKPGITETVADFVTPHLPGRECGALIKAASPNPDTSIRVKTLPAFFRAGYRIFFKSLTHRWIPGCPGRVSPMIGYLTITLPEMFHGESIVIDRDERIPERVNFGRGRLSLC
jgi:hypothetical protein